MLAIGFFVRDSIGIRPAPHLFMVRQYSVLFDFLLIEELLYQIHAHHKCLTSHSAFSQYIPFGMLLLVIQAIMHICLETRLITWEFVVHLKKNNYEQQKFNIPWNCIVILFLGECFHSMSLILTRRMRCCRKHLYNTNKKRH